MRAAHAVRLLCFMALGMRICAAETDCFRSVEEAVARSGVRDPRGFRFDSRVEDAFGGRSWARVVYCANPERPALMVMMGAERADREVSMPPHDATPVGQHSDPGVLVRAGSGVRVVVTDSMVRLEMPGVAQASGAAGERIKVRLLATGENSRERFVMAVVVGSGVVELEP